jgi:hypothetical protein
MGEARLGHDLLDRNAVKSEAVEQLPGAENDSGSGFLAMTRRIRHSGPPVHDRLRDGTALKMNITARLHGIASTKDYVDHLLLARSTAGGGCEPSSQIEFELPDPNQEE